MLSIFINVYPRLSSSVYSEKNNNFLIEMMTIFQSLKVGFTSEKCDVVSCEAKSDLWAPIRINL